MKYRFKPAEQFWRSFYSLPSTQKESVRHVWEIFKLNPFDSRLGVHKIQSLSAFYKKTVYSVVIEPNLRVVFMIEADMVITLDVGSHDIYNT
jgi:hypothetical protein